MKETGRFSSNNEVHVGYLLRKWKSIKRKSQILILLSLEKGLIISNG